MNRDSPNIMKRYQFLSVEVFSTAVIVGDTEICMGYFRK